MSDIGAVPPGSRIVVAMSGGVDSSVTAALLQRQGYDVVGITLQLYDHGEATARKGACCAGQDIHDARRVADRLGIPHYVLDYESRFRREVMADFADSYQAGETPIPCVRCNQRVKFRDLLENARELGAVALATGHYARIEEGAAGRELHKAADGDRDQSYFLFATTPAQLDFLMFPLGGKTKPEIRALAAEFDLPVAEKPDSQDICFVPQGRYASVVERLQPGAAEPGEIVDLEGRVLGRHEGVIHYTVGQRRGLGIAGRRAALCRPPRCRPPARGRRPQGGARLHRCAPAGDQLAGRRRAGGRRPAGHRQAALGEPRRAGPAAARRRGPLRRARGRRGARPGLRLLSRQPRAGRRLHRPVPSGGGCVSTTELVEILRKRALGFPKLGYKVKVQLDEGGIIFWDGTADQPAVSEEDGEADTTLRLSEDNFRKLLDGNLDPTLAYMTGKLKVEGKLGVAMKINSLLSD